jgi:hypothetical protein
LREYLTQDEIQLLQRKLYDFQQDEFIGNVSDDIDDLIDEDENFDEEQKEVEESIKSTVSEKSMNDEEE